MVREHQCSAHTSRGHRAHAPHLKNGHGIFPMYVPLYHAMIRQAAYVDAPTSSESSGHSCGSLLLHSARASTGEEGVGEEP